jgi:hypothetical protein
MKLSTLLICIISLSLQTYGQTALPPGSIDGAATPDQIPDVVATRLFLAAIAEPIPPNSTPAPPSPRQAGKLLPMGLNAADAMALRQAASTWRAQVSAAAGTAADLDGLTQSAMTSLQEQMTADGFASFLAHVRAQKKYMKRIPAPATAH